MMVGIHYPLGFAETLSAGSMVFLVIAVGLALAFEFVNGFHDTANAVATVIYTHSLPPWIAVVWSGLCNLTGVLLSTGAVAFSILAILPVELILNVGSGAGFAMIFALLISAILWNLGTWYLGLPASSTHTMVGSILGVGVANALLKGQSLWSGINWVQVEKVFVTLIVSPIVGFCAAGLLLLVLKLVIRNKALFQPPPKDQPPPWWIRIMLIFTCTGVSYAHGSNDGQKGMGLLLLILIGILPGEFALNLNWTAADVQKLKMSAAMVQPMLETHITAMAAEAADDAAQNTGDPEIGGAANSITGPQIAGGRPNPDADELTRYNSSEGKLTDATYASLAAMNRAINEIIEGQKQSLGSPGCSAERAA